MSDESNKQDTPAPAADTLSTSQLGPFVMPIDGPLSVTFSAKRMDINIVMGLSGQTDGLKTVLQLTPDATGQLVGAIKKALDDRLIEVSIGQPRALQ